MLSCVNDTKNYSGDIISPGIFNNDRLAKGVEVLQSTILCHPIYGLNFSGNKTIGSPHAVGFEIALISKLANTFSRTCIMVFYLDSDKMNPTCK